jgi:peptidoglycan hydrolase-like protein with peptidoglycan-binding domain
MTDASPVMPDEAAADGTPSLTAGLEVSEMPLGEMVSVPLDQGGDMPAGNMSTSGTAGDAGESGEPAPDVGLTIREMPTGAITAETSGGKESGASGSKARTVTWAELESLTRDKSFVPKVAGLALGAIGKDVERLQNYLREFGYIGAEKHQAFGESVRAEKPVSLAAGEFDAETERALKAFQKFNNLAVTGRLDEATLALMSRPRCGFPDNSADFTAQGSKWNKNALTYGFNEFSTDLTQAEVRTAISRAFSQWSAVTPLTFTEVPVSSNPDILIRCVAGNHGDGNNFDGPSGVLAHAYYPPPGGGTLAGDTHFDEAEKWTVNLPPSGIDLESVALHEFGHALGLAHSSVAGAVMAPYYTGAHRALESDDIAGIRSLYGSQGVGPRSVA